MDTKRIGRYAGLLLFFLPFFLDALLSVKLCLAVVLLMTTWWITEAFPLWYTALIPIFALPALGIASPFALIPSYFHSVMLLFLAGFLLSIALQKWGVDTLLSHKMVQVFGASSHMLLLGFICCSAFLSMWMSNTAAAIVMITLALSFDRRITTPLVMACAYAATIGGMGTLIGTIPNALFAASIQELFGQSVSFFVWMKLGIPVMALGLALLWITLRMAFSLPDVTFKQKRVRFENTQLIILGVLTLMAVSWILASVFSIEDTWVAIAGSVLLFTLPSKEGRILSPRDLTKVPWTLFILFGGGLALAKGMHLSGLDTYLVEYLGFLSGFPPLVALIGVVISTVVATEIMSNTALAAMLLPVVAQLAPVVGLHPYMLMFAVAIGSSCGFMMPIGTPPNMVMYGTGIVPLRTMLRVGFALNIVMSSLIVIMAYFLLPYSGLI